ncbi:hypothetical protein U9R90_05680 [Streptomyces sp. E11-3]|uniref:hypothetical protein n=1 Tax=Streptomyces sp. E11-3 TaxID=3110112 RepID=UPI003980A70A
MALIALLIPVLMLGVVLALGRYEELLLPPEESAEPAGFAPRVAGQPKYVLRTGGTSVGAATPPPGVSPGTGAPLSR